MQRFMDKVLEPHKEYARCYIDDVVVFSKTYEDHIRQVRRVLNRLAAFVQLLGRMVDRYGLSTIKERTDALAQIQFPNTYDTIDVVEDDTGSHEEWELQSIIAKRYNKRRKRDEWYVKWKNWGSEFNTWEPRQDQLAEFEDKGNAVINIATTLFDASQNAILQGRLTASLPPSTQDRRRLPPSTHPPRLLPPYAPATPSV
jgi:hypothetical protein